METSQSDFLWAEFSELMRHHQKTDDLRPIDAMNRILRERWAGNGSFPKFSESDLRIERTRWTTQQLYDVIRKDKTAVNIKPGRSKYSVIVLNFRGKSYAVDGRRRINTWVNERTVGDHAVILLTHKSEI